MSSDRLLTLTYFHRNTEAPLLEAAHQFRALVLTGSRQTGKSKLYREGTARKNYLVYREVGHRLNLETGSFGITEKK